jgi:hypothetical protein
VTSAPSRANSTGDGAADSRIAAGDDRGEAVELAAAAVVGRHELRRELELGFAAGLLQVLRRELLGLLARAGLHRLLLLRIVRRLRRLLPRVLAVLRLLDLALPARGGARR